MFFPAWPHKSPSAYTYRITASMPFGNYMSPSTGSVPLGNYMSFPLVLFPSEILPITASAVPRIQLPLLPRY